MVQGRTTNSWQAGRMQVLPGFPWGGCRPSRGSGSLQSLNDESTARYGLLEARRQGSTRPSSRGETRFCQICMSKAAKPHACDLCRCMASRWSRAPLRALIINVQGTVPKFASDSSELRSVGLSSAGANFNDDVRRLIRGSARIHVRVRGRGRPRHRPKTRRDTERYSVDFGGFGGGEQERAREKRGKGVITQG